MLADASEEKRSLHRAMRCARRARQIHARKRAANLHEQTQFRCEPQVKSLEPLPVGQGVVMNESGEQTLRGKQLRRCKRLYSCIEEKARAKARRREAHDMAAANHSQAREAAAQRRNGGLFVVKARSDEFRTLAKVAASQAEFFDIGSDDWFDALWPTAPPGPQVLPARTANTHLQMLQDLARTLPPHELGKTPARGWGHVLREQRKMVRDVANPSAKAYDHGMQHIGWDVSLLECGLAAAGASLDVSALEVAVLATLFLLIETSKPSEQVMPGARTVAKRNTESP